MQAEADQQNIFFFTNKHNMYTSTNICMQILEKK